MTRRRYDISPKKWHYRLPFYTVSTPFYTVSMPFYTVSMPFYTAFRYEMSPKKWHYRLPFFGKDINDTDVEVNDHSAATLAQEHECLLIQ